MLLRRTVFLLGCVAGCEQVVSERTREEREGNARLRGDELPSLNSEILINEGVRPALLRSGLGPPSARPTKHSQFYFPPSSHPALA